MVETNYLLKYVDKKESAGTFSNPWSIRQALVYQNSDLEAGRDTYIFIRVSELLGDRFRDLLSKRKAREMGPRMLHWSEIHSMVFKSVIVNWREYINWLDRDVSQLVSLTIFIPFPSCTSRLWMAEINTSCLANYKGQFDSLILAAVEPTKLGSLDSVSSSLNLMKRLQYMLDQALRTAHMLDLNIEVMQRIQGAATRAKDLDAEDMKRKYEALYEDLDGAISEHVFLRKNVLSLVERSKILSQQVHAFLFLLRNSLLRGFS
jgi:hypothetical protein